MTLRAELPHFRALCRDGSSWLLPLEVEEEFAVAWMGGRTFWTGTCAYGSFVRVKLGDITGTSRWDEARIVLWRDECEEERRRELTEGSA